MHAISDWEEVVGSSQWAPRWKHTSVSFDGKLWVMGGNSSRGDVWSSPDGITWSLAVGSAAWPGRADHASLVYGGKMWVIGGVNSFTHSVHNEARYNDAWWSVDGASWENATTDAPWVRRWGHSALVHQGKMWVIGGYMGPEFLNDVWWSTDGAEWTAATMEAEWPGRADFAAASYDGKMWIMGGNAGDPSIDFLLPYGDVWCSEDGANWTQVMEEAPWTKRRFHSALPFGGRFWMIGGGFPHFHAPVFAMTSEMWTTTNGKDWALENDAPGWDPRGENTTVVHDGRIWVMGGWNQDRGLVNDVWRSPLLFDEMRSDLNEDGVVDSTDLLILLKDWGKVSGP